MQYVRLEALTEVAGNPWTSMAEFNLLDTNGELIDRSRLDRDSADSVETVGENGAAANAIDGNAATHLAHAVASASPPHPHTFTVEPR